MKQLKRRKIQDKLEGYLDYKQAIVITGMRRVGKTTLLKYLFEKVKSKNKIFLNLEDTLTRKIFSEENYKNIVLALQQEGIDFERKSYILIDEIQYIKNLPSIIKYLYDEFSIKFILTGSSSFYLKNHFTESLAGRKIIVDLYPLTFNEFLEFKGIKKDKPRSLKSKVSAKTEINAEKFNDLYKEYIDFGGFPEVVLAPTAQNKKVLLNDILNSYFQMDVTTLADFENVGKIRDLLILLTQRIGQKMNISNLANALRVKREKIYSYLEFLQATYVIRLLPQQSSIDNRVSAENKLYFTDTGLARMLGDISEGNQLENSIFMNLVYDYDLTYYQTKSGGEIDFILDNEIGLEVKISPSQQDIANLKKRAKSADIRKYYVVGIIFNKHPNVIMAWDL